MHPKNDSMKVTILRESEIRSCASMSEEAVRAVAYGFTCLTEGKVSLPPIIRVDVDANNGEVDIKTAYIEGLDSFAIKVASGFFGNPEIGSDLWERADAANECNNPVC